jgi:hypothetical protein
MASKLHAPRRRPLAIALIVALHTEIATARAEPSAADRETARALMAEGRSKRDAGDLAGALKAFRGADAIMHVPTTGLEVARTHALRGELVEARDVALQVARSIPQPDEPAPFAEARRNAEALAAELEGRIGSLTVVLRGKGDVTIDDAPIPAEIVGMPRKVNPGRHVVVARTGDTVRRTEVDVAEGGGATVELDLTSTPRRRSTPNWVALSGFGFAGLGVVVGTITGVASIAQTSSLKDRCPNDRCPPNAAGDLDSASALATTSTVAFVIAGIGAAVGVAGLLLAPKRPETSSAARVEPWIGAGAVGLRATF